MDKNNETLTVDMEPGVVQRKWREEAEEAVNIAIRQLVASSSHKEPFLEKMVKYENLYAGRLPKKLRIQFNVVLPIFSGMIDTICSDFDEGIDLNFKDTHPSDYFAAKKIKAAFDKIKNSSRVNDKWDYKIRQDKKLAVMSGRGILSYYAESDPEYKSVLEVVDYHDFHCQPLGGGLLENHLFAGQENVLRSKSQLEKGAETGFYNNEMVKELIERANKPEYVEEVNQAVSGKLSRFKALGLDAESDNYVGESTYNLVKWVLTVKGERKYLLFDPRTKTPIRYEPLKETYSSEEMPWKSWATHEDMKVFWSKCFGDDFFPVADAIIALFNQELTNREKKNLGARAYDVDMFQDVAKLDAAQYRADALVPANTNGGTKRISEGIYHFQTAELTGTINLIDWISNTAGDEIGVTDASKGAAQSAGKKVGVLFQEKDALAKRVGYRASSYSECLNEIGDAFVQGLKDCMPASMAVRMLGPDGYEWDEITRLDLNTKEPLEIEVVSSLHQVQESNMKKGARVKALEMVANDPTLAPIINPKWRAESILKYVGDFEDSEIKEALDVQSYGSSETMARAYSAIQELIRGKKPEMNWDADTKFLQVIVDYMKKHKTKLIKDSKYIAFNEYLKEHMPIASENMARIGVDMNRKNNLQKFQGNGASATATPTSGAPVTPTTPATTPVKPAQ